MTYQEVAAETGVSVNNLKKWGIKGGWTQQRAKFEEEFLAQSAGLSRLIVEQMARCAKSGHSQDVIALTNLLKTKRALNTLRPQQFDKAAFVLEILNRLVEYLREKSPDSLNHLEPQIRGFAEEIKGWT